MPQVVVRNIAGDQVLGPISGPVTIAEIKRCLLADASQPSWICPNVLCGTILLQDDLVAGALVDATLTVTWTSRPSTDPIFCALIRRIEVAEAEHGLESPELEQAVHHLLRAFQYKEPEDNEYAYLDALRSRQAEWW
mmetsp:Transcript_68659/g.119262  ORF Transcript_68659/g.119262 Transcript_68659/m.119262 type:complete len:137 (-) Transcript_68659:270-680(-)